MMFDLNLAAFALISLGMFLAAFLAWRLLASMAGPADGKRPLWVGGTSATFNEQPWG